MNEISKLKDVNSIFGGVYLPGALTRCSMVSAVAKLHFAHLAQNANSHNLVQLNFLFSVSELGFLDEREIIEMLDELESFGMILVQRGNSNSELVVVTLMPEFTEILREREAKGRRKKRVRHSATYDLKYAQSGGLSKHNQSGMPNDVKEVSQSSAKFETASKELPLTMQNELFSTADGKSVIRRKFNRKQPRSRHTLQDCRNFAQYQRQLNGAEKIPTPDRFAVALYTTGQQDEEIDLFLLSRHQYHQPQNADQSVVH